MSDTQHTREERFQTKGIRDGARVHIDDWRTKDEAIESARAALKDFDRVVVLDDEADIVWDSDSATDA